MGRKLAISACLYLALTHQAWSLMCCLQLGESVREQLWVYRTVMEMMGHVTLLADGSDHGAGRGSLPAYCSQS